MEVEGSEAGVGVRDFWRERKEAKEPRLGAGLGRGRALAASSKRRSVSRVVREGLVGGVVESVQVLRLEGGL